MSRGTNGVLSQVGHRWGTPVKSKWMVMSKRRSVFSHTQAIAHDGKVQSFSYTDKDKPTHRGCMAA